MTKVVNGILILRGLKATPWTPALDEQMVGWSKEYISWLQTAPIALEEAAAAKLVLMHSKADLRLDISSQ